MSEPHTNVQSLPATVNQQVTASTFRNNRAIDKDPRPPPSTTSLPQVKKPRFTKPANTRRGGAAYQKAPLKSSLSGYLCHTFYPVHTSNNGVYNMATVIYNYMLGYDARIALMISVHQMAYVTTIAFCLRVTTVSHSAGYALGISGYDNLSQAATGILLPEFLARYIEAVGLVLLPSGVTLAPFSGTYREMFPLNSAVTLDPAKILIDAGREVPDGDWAIDWEWITLWNDNVSKAARKGLRFRKVAYTEPTGRVEMTVSKQADGDMVVSFAPTQIMEAEMHLGACYAYRDYSERRYWLSRHHSLLFRAFGAPAINTTVFMTELIAAAFAVKDKE